MNASLPSSRTLLSRSPRRAILATGVAALVTAWFAPSLSAQTYRWSGGANTNDSTNAGNWLGGVVPPNNVNATNLLFDIQPAGSAVNPTFTGSFGANSLTFQFVNTAMTLSGNVFFVGAGGIVNNNTVTTINPTGLVLASSQTWTVGASDTLVVSSIIQNGFFGPSSLTIAGTGFTTLTGLSTYTGGTTVTGGATLSLYGADGVGTGTIVGSLLIDSNSQVQLNTNNSMGYIPGKKIDSVQINPNGTLYANSGGQGWGVNYTLNGGYLISNNATASTTTGNYFQFGGPAGNPTAVNVTSASGGIYGRVDLRTDAGNSTVTFNIDTGGQLVMHAAITGAGGFIKTGGGLMNLFPDVGSTYTGVTTINQGSIWLSSLANGGSPSAIGASSNAAANLVFNGGTLTYLGGATSTDRLFSLGPNGGTLSAVGSGALTMTNTGALGYLTANTSQTLTLDGNTSSGSGLGTLAAAIGNNGSGVTSLTKTGNGKWILSGTSTYSGQTTISAGSLQLAGTLYGVSGAGTIDVANGAALLLALGDTFGNHASMPASTIIIEAGGLVSNAGALFNTVNNLVINGGELRSNGGFSSIFPSYQLKGTVTVGGTGASSFTANTSVNTFNGIQLGNNTAGGVTTFAVTNAPASLSIANILQDGQNLSVSGTVPSALTKTGAGTLFLNGANTYTGITKISAGTLSTPSLANGGTASGIGAAGNAATNLVFDGGVLAYTGATASTDRGFSVNATGGTINVSTAATNLTMSGIGKSSGASASFSKLGAGTLTFAGAGDNTTLAALVSAGTLILGKTSSGTVHALGAPTDANALDLEGGTVQLAGTGGDQILDATGVLINSGILDLNGLSETVNSFNGSGGTVTNNATGTSTFTVSGSDAVAGSGTFSGTMADGGVGKILAFTKGGPGTFTMNHANTYTGATTINAGTLKHGVANAISATSAVTVNSGGTYDLAGLASSIGSLAGAGNVTLGAGTLNTGNNNTSTIFSGLISGSGALVKSGSGTMTVTSAQSYLGGTTVSGGIFQLGNGGATGALASTGGITNNANLTFNRSNALAQGTDFGTISGSGSVTQAGPGTTTLNAANSYTGPTTISGGTLSNGANNAVPSGSAVTVNSGAIYNLAGFTDTIGSLAGVGNVTLGAGGLNAGGNNTSTSYSGVISGAGSVTKAGTGTWTLGGANVYTGATAISGGKVMLGINNALSGSTALTITSGATFDLGNFSDSIGSLAGGGSVTLGSGLLSTGGDNTSTSYSGVISGTGAVTKTGSGTWTVSGANNYTGATTVSTGTLTQGAANAVPSSSAVTVAATYNLAGFASTIGSLAGAGSVTMGSNAVLSAGGNNTSTGFSGVISGTGGSVNKSGSGTWTLSGANLYTGATNVSAGTLQVNNTLLSTVYGLSGGSLTLGASNLLPTTSAFTLTGGTLALGAFGNTVGSVSLQSGSITGATGVLTSTSAYDLQSGSVSGILGGTVGLTKSTAGSVTLSGANSYSGPTNVNGGTLALGAANSVPTASALNVASGAIFNLAGFADTVGSLAGAGSVTLGSATLTAGGTNASTTFSGLLSGTGGFTKSGSGTQTLSNASTYTGITTINGGILAAPALPNGGISGSIGASSNAAANLVLNGGTLQYVGTTSNPSTDRLFTLGANGGALDASGTNAFTFAGNGSGSSNAIAYQGTGTSPTFTLTGTGVGIFAPIIGNNSGGTTALSKTGPGSWTLNATNTFSGGTDIAGGTLTITSHGASASSLGSGSLHVGLSGTLAGSGAVLGAANVDGALAPGSGPSSTSQLSFASSLAFSSTAQLQLELSGTNPGTDYDQIIVNGQVTLGGNLVVSLFNGFTPTVGQKFYILDNTPLNLTIGGVFANAVVASATTGILTMPGARYLVNYADIYPFDSNSTANDITLTYIGVPEPGTGISLLGGGALLLGWGRRRRSWSL